MEKYTLVYSDTCKKVLEKYPNYKVFWRSGLAYKGAGEVEDNRHSLDFESKMQRRYNWAAAIDIEINNEEIHFNGFSVNDLY